MKQEKGYKTLIVPTMIELNENVDADVVEGMDNNENQVNAPP